MQIDDTPALRARFWSKVDRNGPIPEHRPELGPCWVWTGSKTRGYGQLSSRRGCAPHRAHIISWELHNGPITDDLWVLHHCDNRPCVRPTHLFLGNRQNNVDDAVGKNRHSHGIGRPASKLTDEDVRAIRAIPEGSMSHSQMAELYPVGPSVIGYIRRGKAWTHVQ